MGSEGNSGSKTAIGRFTAEGNKRGVSRQTQSSERGQKRHLGWKRYCGTAYPPFYGKWMPQRETHELPLTALLFKFASWMGGDRDGNLQVTSKVTREVCLTNLSRPRRC